MIVTLRDATAAALQLGLELDGLTEGVVKVAYRVRARATHPDHGGDAAAFAAVDRSKHVLLHWLAANAAKPVNVPHGLRCVACNGMGSVYAQRAFRRLRVQCPSCRGAGEMFVEQEKGDQH